MLDTVIKNTILFGLLIMIVHFMIKNELVDSAARRRVEFFMDNKPLPLPIPAPHDELATFFLEATSPKKADAMAAASPCATDEAQRAKAQLKDLYDYVYADKEAPGELGTLYNDNVKSDCIQGSKKTVKCDLVGNNVGDKRMCKTLIDAHIDKQQKEEAPLVEKADEGYRFGVRVKDYKNEAVMNGAYIEGTRLTGFDTNDMLFASVY